jgi:hypothetical protein
VESRERGTGSGEPGAGREARGAGTRAWGPGLSSRALKRTGRARASAAWSPTWAGAARGEGAIGPRGVSTDVPERRCAAVPTSRSLGNALEPGAQARDAARGRRAQGGLGGPGSVDPWEAGGDHAARRLHRPCSVTRVCFVRRLPFPPASFVHPLHFPV